MTAPIEGTFSTRAIGAKSVYDVRIYGENERIRPDFDLFHFIRPSELGIKESEEKKWGKVLNHYIINDRSIFRDYLVDLITDSIWFYVRDCGKRIDEKLIRHLVKSSLFVRPGADFGVIWQSQTTMAHILGMVPLTVARNLRNLESLGILNVKAGKKWNTRKLYRHYIDKLNRLGFKILADEHGNILQESIKIQGDCIYYPVMNYDFIFSKMECGRSTILVNGRGKETISRHEMTRMKLIDVLKTYINAKMEELKTKADVENIEEKLKDGKKRIEADWKRRSMKIKHKFDQNASIIGSSYAFEPAVVKPEAVKKYWDYRLDYKKKLGVSSYKIEFTINELLDDIPIASEWLKNITYLYIHGKKDKRGLDRVDRGHSTYSEMMEFIRENNLMEEFAGYLKKVLSEKNVLAAPYKFLGLDFDDSANIIKPMLEQQRFGLMTQIAYNSGIKKNGKNVAITSFSDIKNYEKILRRKLNSAEPGSELFVNAYNILDLNKLINEVPNIDKSAIMSRIVNFVEAIRTLILKGEDIVEEYVRIWKCFTGRNKSPVVVISNLVGYLEEKYFPKK